MIFACQDLGDDYLVVLKERLDWENCVDLGQHCGGVMSDNCIIFVLFGVVGGYNEVESQLA